MRIRRHKPLTPSPEHTAPPADEASEITSKSDLMHKGAELDDSALTLSLADQHMSRFAVVGATDTPVTTEHEDVVEEKELIDSASVDVGAAQADASDAKNAEYRAKQAEIQANQEARGDKPHTPESDAKNAEYRAKQAEIQANQEARAGDTAHKGADLDDSASTLSLADEHMARFAVVSPGVDITTVGHKDLTDTTGHKDLVESKYAPDERAAESAWKVATDEIEDNAKGRASVDDGATKKFEGMKDAEAAGYKDAEQVKLAVAGAEKQFEKQFDEVGFKESDWKDAGDDLQIEVVDARPVDWDTTSHKGADWEGDGFKLVEHEGIKLVEHEGIKLVEAGIKDSGGFKDLGPTVAEIDEFAVNFEVTGPPIVTLDAAVDFEGIKHADFVVDTPNDLLIDTAVADDTGTWDEAAVAPMADPIAVLAPELSVDLLAADLTYESADGLWQGLDTGLPAVDGSADIGDMGDVDGLDVVDGI